MSALISSSLSAIKKVPNSHNIFRIRNMSTILRKLITTSNAPQPVAPYTQAVVADRTVYVSGCLGLDKDTGKIVSGGVAAEAELTLSNLKNVLIASGSDLDKVVKATIFLQDLNDFETVNEAYKNAFPTHYPARTCIQVAKLPLNALVEIEAIALIGDVKTISVSL